MADTLAPGRILVRICPARLHGWVSLCNTAIYSWLDDRAPTMGAAIAYYTVFSLAPMLVMVIAVAGLAFGQQAAEGALFEELADLVVDRRPHRHAARPEGGECQAARVVYALLKTRYG